MKKLLIGLLVFSSVSVSVSASSVSAEAEKRCMENLISNSNLQKKLVGEELLGEYAQLDLIDLYELITIRPRLQRTGRWKNGEYQQRVILLECCYEGPRTNKCRSANQHIRDYYDSIF